MTINPRVWTLNKPATGCWGRPALLMAICCKASRIMITSKLFFVELQVVDHLGTPHEYRSQCCKILFSSAKKGGCSKGARGDILTPQENLGTMKNMLNMMITPILGQTDCKEALQNHPTILVKGCDMVRGFQVMISRLRPLYNVHMTDYTKITLLNHRHHQMQGYFCSLCKTF